MDRLASHLREVQGVRLRQDPARDGRFRVVHRETEMYVSSGRSEEDKRASMHRDMNSELQDLEVTASTLADFPDAPWDLRLQLARQCWDETRHVRLFARRVEELGGFTGEFPIRNPNWGVVGAIDTLAGRLLLQNRLFEGGSMDIFRKHAAHFWDTGDDRSAELMETVLVDEIQHVRNANRWLRAEIARRPRTVFELARAVNLAIEAMLAMHPRPGDRRVNRVEIVETAGHFPTNEDDRALAGFTRTEIADLIRREKFGDVRSWAASGP